MKNKVSCILETVNNDGTKKFDASSSSSTNAAGRRKKGEAPADFKVKECPKDFEKVSEQLCLHYYDSVSTFQASGTYCENKNKETTLFRFTNSSEALEVWKWLGKY